MYTIVVESDVNDADYITSEFVVNEERFLYISEICRKIGNSNMDYRQPVGKREKFIKAFEGVLTEEEADYIYDVVPRLEGYGVLEGIRFYIGTATTLL